MSTCEELGYKVGDKFEVLSERWGFKKGTIVTLYRINDEEGTTLFKGPNSYFKLAGEEEGAYLNIKYVRKIGSVEQNSKNSKGEDIMNNKQQQKKKIVPKGVKQGSITFVYTGTQYKVSGVFEIAVNTSMNADGLVSTSVGYELDVEKGDSHYVGHVEMTVPEDLRYILVKQPNKQDKIVELS